MTSHRLALHRLRSLQEGRGATGSLALHLVGCGGPFPMPLLPSTLLLPEDGLVVGRLPSCEWVIGDPFIAPTHARLWPTSIGVYVEALDVLGSVRVGRENLALHAPRLALARTPIQLGRTLWCVRRVGSVDVVSP